MFLLLFVKAFSLIAYPLNIDCPTIIKRDAWGYNQAPLAYGQNYSLFMPPDGAGCNIAGFDYTGVARGKLMLTNEPSNTCGYGRYPNIYASGAVAAIGPNIVGHFGMMIINWHPETVQLAKNGLLQPVLSCTSSTIYEPYNFNSVDFAKGFWPIYFTAFKNPNITINLTPPVPNQMWMDFRTSGSTTQFCYAANIISSLALLMVATAKINYFLHIQGFRLTLPIVTLLFAIIGAIVGVFHSEVGFFAWRGSIHVYFWNFWIFWPLACAITMEILMGLYFKEIASLTSSKLPNIQCFFVSDSFFFLGKKVPGLDVMFWPAVILIGGAWFMVLLAGGFQTNPQLNLGSNAQTGVFAILIVVISIGFLIVVYGTIFLLIGIRGVEGEAKKAILSVIAVTGFATLTNTACGLAFLVEINYIPNLWNNSMGIVNIVCFYELFMVFVPNCVMLMFCVNFRITVEKEIEVSKSATSSTSSFGGKSSTSSSSSSSSSKHQEPVIEL